MRIIEQTHTRELAVSAAVAMWNYWDHEHLTVVHRNYTNAKILYENERVVLIWLTFRLPILSFIKSTSLNVMIQEDAETIRAINLGLLGVPAETIVTVKEIRKDHCVLTMRYRFFLKGWKIFLAPFIMRMIPKWNEQVWLEDLPLKLRRQKVLRMGFKDFVGLPERLEDRVYEGDIKLQLPIARFKTSPVNLDSLMVK